MPERSTQQPRDNARAARLGPRLLLIKAVLLLALALAGAALSRIPAIREALAPAGHVSEWLRNMGGAAIPAFILGTGLLIAMGVPRLVFCPVAGAAFGFGTGLVTSTTATMLAYFGTFLFIRGRLADRETPFELPPRLAFLRVDPGLPGVILTRLIPVPGLIGTIALSLSPVRRRTYLLGSFLGLIPEAVPLVLLGAGLFEGNPKQLAWLGAGALLLVVACYLLMRRILRRTADHPGDR